MERLEMRPFEEHDWPDMVRFYEQFYRPGYIFTNRAFFDWNFAAPLRSDNRSGQRLILDGGRVVGILGVIAGWPLQVDGKYVAAQTNLNLFVDPAYRGKRLGEQLFALAVSETRYNLISGYNERTYPMYLRLGKIRNWRMRRFTRTIEAEAVAALVNGNPRFAALGDADKESILASIFGRRDTILKHAVPLERVDRFGAQWDEAWDSIRANYGLTTWRNAQFLNWRYIDYPFPLYRCFIVRTGGSITGFVALRTENPPCGPVVRVVDFVAAPEARYGMLAAIEETARREKVVFIDYLAAGAVDPDTLLKTGYRELADPTGSSLLPMDLNPYRYRDYIPGLAIFADRNDPASVEVETGNFYVVKGDADQDRAN